MILRADHVAGAAFIGFGALILAVSGDLPAGQLSMPGSGFLPKIVAVLMMLFGALLMAGAPKESETFAKLGWSDAPHAIQVIAITAAGISLYTVLGFIATLVLMVAALLIIIERRNPLRAALYAVAIVAFAYVGFQSVLKTPLPHGPWGF